MKSPSLEVLSTQLVGPEQPDLPVPALSRSPATQMIHSARECNIRTVILSNFTDATAGGDSCPI